MTRIDFAFGAPDRLRTACQVVRKRYLAGQRLDDTSFVPHVLANDPLAGETPVILTAGDPQQAAAAAGQGGQPQPSWLLNLDLDCPPGFEAFERLLEIVSDDPDDKQAARQRWRTYLAAGHTPQSHDLSRQQPDG
jgi:DNA polymerase-3 subunit chi